MGGDIGKVVLKCYLLPIACTVSYGDNGSIVNAYNTITSFDAWIASDPGTAKPVGDVSPGQQTARIGAYPFALATQAKVRSSAISQRSMR
jgi:hypothetical protein